MFSQKTNQKISPRLLYLVDYHDPILRKKTNLVSFPLSEEDKQIIEDMQYSIQGKQLKEAKAPFDSAAGMAANQWGIDKQIFLFSPRAREVEVIINPSYEPLEEASVLGWEACFSIPLTMSHVKRYITIKARYQNEAGVLQEKILKDWTARIFQHETDHLNGVLNNNLQAGSCIETRTFNSMAELEAFESNTN